MPLELHASSPLFIIMRRLLLLRTVPRDRPPGQPPRRAALLVATSLVAGEQRGRTPFDAGSPPIYIVIRYINQSGGSPRRSPRRGTPSAWPVPTTWSPWQGPLRDRPVATATAGRGPPGDLRRTPPWRRAGPRRRPSRPSAPHRQAAGEQLLARPSSVPGNPGPAPPAGPLTPRQRTAA
jgi:hypothetical protein